ncbi:MAG: DUF1549 and DUF1553 domain-containing protein [Zavarzinella sp.]
MRFSSFYLLFLAGSAIGADSPSFINEVMPVLSRSGCNMGACHGNLNGKGGFKLSLRGEDSAFDHERLTREHFGRRINIFQPETSIILQKAVGLIAHEGGPRFSVESPEYQILADWIRHGATFDSKSAPKIVALDVRPRLIIKFEADQEMPQLLVTGRFSDGTVRNLTHLCNYDLAEEGIVAVAQDGKLQRLSLGETTIAVRFQQFQLPIVVAIAPNRTDYQPPAANPPHPIDALIQQQLHLRRITPAPLADDAIFLRRSYLDLLGILPTPSEAKAFLEQKDTEKRTKLIDELLKRPELAHHWAQKWSDLLRNEEKALDAKGVKVFYEWIRSQIAGDQPLNEFAAAIVSARGSSYQRPETNLYRSLRDPYSRAEAVAQVFLGVRIGCAKCHNHPFDQWTQQDYHQFAATFSQIDYRVLSNNRKDQLDQHEFSGEQQIFVNLKLSMPNPKGGLSLQPRLLGEMEALAANSDYLGQLGNWLSNPQNQFFARAQANRIWYHLFGKGLVEPNDDFRASNPPVNEPLLNFLATEFRKHHFRLKPILRLIMTSDAYQRRSSEETEHADERHFSRMMVRPFQAEVLHDAVAQMLGTKPKIAGYPVGMRAGELPALPAVARGKTADASSRFLKTFGKPERLLTCDCERNDDPGVLQSFQLLNGDLLQSLLTEPDNRLAGYLPVSSPSQIAASIEDLYWWGFTRRPSHAELNKLVDYVLRSTDRRAAFEDIAWSMINAKEFLLKR